MMVSQLTPIIPEAQLHTYVKKFAVFWHNPPFRHGSKKQGIGVSQLEFVHGGFA